MIMIMFGCFPGFVFSEPGVAMTSELDMIRSKTHKTEIVVITLSNAYLILVYINDNKLFGVCT